MTDTPAAAVLAVTAYRMDAGEHTATVSAFAMILALGALIDLVTIQTRTQATRDLRRNV